MNETAMRLAGGVALLACCGIACALELPAEIREKIFKPTADVRLAHETVQVPMRGEDRNGFYECPYFRVYVNGKGPFTFLFDTGSSYTLVSDRVVEAARPTVAFDRGGERDVVRLESVEFGELTLRDVWAIHQDGFDVDGVLGFQAFGLNPFAIDFVTRVLTVGSQPSPSARSFELPYEAPRHVPLVPIAIGGRRLQILVDTGDDAYGLELRGEELADARVDHVPVAAATVLNGTVGQTTRVTTLVDDVVLGPVRAQSAVIGVNDDLPVGDLGYDALRQFRVMFDPVRRVARFEPSFEGDVFSLSGERVAGFSLKFDDSGEVTRVTRESPAEAAGIAVGDQILAIEGQAVSGFSRRHWDEVVQRSRAMKLRWRHGSEIRSAEVMTTALH